MNIYIPDFVIYLIAVAATILVIMKLKQYENIKGLILSGGPSTVTTKKFQSVPKEIFEKKIPILGICYGLQLLSKLFGGKIKPSKKTREFGRVTLYKQKSSLLTKNYLNTKKIFQV